MDDRERLTPIPLTAKQPIAQFIIDGRFSKVIRFQPIGNRIDPFFLGETIDIYANFFIWRINIHAIFGPASFTGQYLWPQIFIGIFGVKDTNDRNIECLGELKVARIVGRNSHNRPGSVTH